MVPEEILERAAVDEVSPRYLRKQRPADATRRRLRKAGSTMRRSALAVLIAVVASAAIGGGVYFLFYSPVMQVHPGQMGITGTQYVSRGRLMQIFSADMGRSVLSVPLGERLTAVENIPWVRSAVVERVLPDRLDLTIVERKPVAFLSTSAGMKLIDADGVILDRPPDANFNLPVVTGLGAATPPAERVRRLELFSEFMKEIGTVRSGAEAEVSEANLSNPDDVQATLDGLPVMAGQGPVVVHFGDADFAGRFRSFLANFAGWQARAGNVEAVDLRYDGEALVTPETPFSSGGPAKVAVPNAAMADAASTVPTPPLSALLGQPVARERPVSMSVKNAKRSARK
ncbi:MAG TPA: FtsQ-type POTRA domain-containing protein [Candidatus Dormibacteraeota bacterium]|nr:FtsQ-type POTRA domain-containing protein [Candidatus Dormibacteraeota bacterium]